MNDVDRHSPTRVRRTLRAIPDHPKPGIIFQDITPVLHDGGAVARRRRGAWPSRSPTAE